MARKRTSSKTRQTNTLRIIGGDWRSRKVPFIDAEGLRPTPDRVRETLFNWLQGDVHGARCLDLFAGSGALGLEALSRGAADVVFVEKNKAVANQLSANLLHLKSTSVVHHFDALSFLSKERVIKRLDKSSFDIIFLDPPFRKGLLEDALRLINKSEIIKNNGLIYLEYEVEKTLDWNAFGLEVLKQTGAGQVNSFLLKPIK